MIIFSEPGFCCAETIKRLGSNFKKKQCRDEELELRGDSYTTARGTCRESEQELAGLYKYLIISDFYI